MLIIIYSFNYYLIIYYYINYYWRLFILIIFNDFNIYVRCYVTKIKAFINGTQTNVGESPPPLPMSQPPNNFAAGRHRSLERSGDAHGQSACALPVCY